MKLNGRFRDRVRYIYHTIAFREGLVVPKVSKENIYIYILVFETSFLFLPGNFMIIDFNGHDVEEWTDQKIISCH